MLTFRNVQAHARRATRANGMSTAEHSLPSTRYVPIHSACIGEFWYPLRSQDTGLLTRVIMHSFGIAVITTHYARRATHTSV